MANKTTTVTFRMNPAVKEMLRIAAGKERRSVANMIEVMVVEYAKKLGIEENTRKTQPDKTTLRGKK
jgi:hypothetical protein